MVCRVHFPEHEGREAFEMHRITACKIESSWDMLTDTAQLTIPKNFAQLRADSIDSWIRPGDPVQIELGYNGITEPYFTGFVRSVGTEYPIVLELEDNMYLLKRHQVEVSFRKTKLKAILQAIVPDGISVESFDTELRLFRYSGTAAGCLAKLAEDYNLHSYFDGDTLLCGIVYADNSTEHEAWLNTTDVAETDLTYTNEDAARVLVKASAVKKNGEKLEVEVGEEDGEVYNLEYHGIESKAEVEKFALEDYKKIKRKGFKGTVTLFGTPRIRHGEVLYIREREGLKREGRLFIDKVTTEYTETPSFRQKLELGPSA